MADSLLANVIYFRFWWRAQELTAEWSRLRSLAFLAPFAVVGLGARLWASTKFRNYDFDSYLIVSTTVLRGGNPYETGRYNYGPVWFAILTAFRTVCSDADSLRIALAVLLGLVDVVLALLVMRRGYLLGAAVILVSPISIAISGQHQQFDNIAITLALAATLLMSTRGPQGSFASVTRTDWAATSLLGLSLATKHVFLVLPLWLALQQRSLRRAMLYALWPLAVFGISLLPFFALDPSAVMTNVVNYQSSNNAPMLTTLAPMPVTTAFVFHGHAVLAFLLCMVAIGGLYRRLPAFETALVYSVSTVVFASAVYDQYLAIPMAAVGAAPNLGLFVWLGEATVYLLGNAGTLAVPGLIGLRQISLPDSDTAYQALFVPLFVGWILMTIWFRRHAFGGAPAVCEEQGVVASVTRET